MVLLKFCLPVTLVLSFLRPSKSTPFDTNFKSQTHDISASNGTYVNDPPTFDPIPEGFDSLYHETGADPIPVLDVFKLFTRAAGALGKMPYNAAMTQTEWRLEHSNPRILVRFSANSGQSLQVRHQLWALYVCTLGIHQHVGRRAYPSICGFGPTEPPDMGKITIRTLRAESSVEPSAKMPALSPSNSSSGTVGTSRSLHGSLALNGAQVKNSTDMIIDDETENNDDTVELKIGDFSTRSIDPQSFAAHSIMMITASASFKVEGREFLVPVILSDTDGITVKWQIPPDPPQEQTASWDTVIRIFAGIFGYMRKHNKFFECHYAALYGERPFLVGQIERSTRSKEGNAIH